MYKNIVANLPIGMDIYISENRHLEIPRHGNNLRNCLLKCRQICCSVVYKDIIWTRCGNKRKRFYLTTNSTILFTVIWRRTYGKGTFRQQERNPAAATI